MADLAAHLVDAVLPDVPCRQWVLSLPHRVRWLCAFDSALCRAVRSILVRAVSGFYLQAGRDLPRPKAGAVVFVQRFDSGLRLNLHFHAIWADGLFACPPGHLSADFHRREQVTDADVARLVRLIRDRVLRCLRRRGRLPAEDGHEPADDPDAGEPSLRQQLGAAAVQGRTALGPDAGRRDPRPGQGSQALPFTKGPLCADLDGFSLHAAVRVPEGCRERLEKLCRYAARPPIAEERLSLRKDGRLLYKLKRRYHDGSTHVLFEPFTLIERLCSLIPSPRKRLVTYHGVFGPAAAYRHRVVPPPPLHDAAGGASCRHRTPGKTPPPDSQDHATAANGASPDAAPPATDSSKPVEAAAAAVPHAPTKTRLPRRRYSWAELMRRVFLFDVLTCPHCHGRRRLLDGIFDPAAIHAILTHLGLPPAPPEIAAARPPPQRQLPW
jgi:hypothetical protein